MGQDEDLKLAIDKHSEIFRGATDLLGSSRPSALKEGNKKPLIETLKTFPQAPRAVQLHNDLVAISI